ncbi:sensor histidine kinase inhibitor, KipI family [Pseudomonas asplenii]|uniref:Sensor histidine kinase inhibitor, KipI family n=2 Tax=Pseudomonas asplenii TaxID=53407 RepID=A0A1H1X6N5_9PSED|nr:sensor histidine kinase inhibitor, KipI family [Pseudomonas asplenii]
MNAPKYHRMGTRGILIESQQGQASIGMQRIYWSLDTACRCLPGLVETVPGMNNLLLILDSVGARENAFPLLSELWDQCAEQSQARITSTVTIGVHYGGDGGADLAQAAHYAGLPIDAFVKRHAMAEYTVFCLGAHPGFAYLGGLDPQLHIPRRAEPRASVSKGTVAIGGSQAGVTAATLPSGWNLIGTTDTVFFDHRITPPALLAPGDTVRFEILGVTA